MTVFWNRECFSLFSNGNCQAMSRRREAKQISPADGQRV